MMRFKGVIQLLASLCMFAAVSACSASIQQDYDDDALSSTKEISRAGAYPTLVQKTKTKLPMFEFKKHANLNSPVKGIYISQTSLENRDYLQYLIARSQASGINTFIIDLHNVTSNYEKNILLVKNSGMRHVARVVLFPNGTDPDNIKSEAYWLSRYRLVEAAIKLGADEIQLDSIRYSPSNISTANLQEIYAVVNWFKSKIADRAKLQVDMFGEIAFKSSDNLGQDMTKFAQIIDAVCPMLYPSHFEPFTAQAKRAYDIVYAGLANIKRSYKGQVPFKVYPYIELSNYRQPFTEEQLVGYIHGQIAAIEDANADGWYAWSSNNKYDRLFSILERRS